MDARTTEERGDIEDAPTDTIKNITATSNTSSISNTISISHMLLWISREELHLIMLQLTTLERRGMTMLAQFPVPLMPLAKLPKALVQSGQHHNPSNQLNYRISEEELHHTTAQSIMPQPIMPQLIMHQLTHQRHGTIMSVQLPEPLTQLARSPKE